MEKKNCDSSGRCFRKKNKLNNLNSDVLQSRSLHRLNVVQVNVRIAFLRTLIILAGSTARWIDLRLLCNLLLGKIDVTPMAGLRFGQRDFHFRSIKVDLGIFNVDNLLECKVSSLESGGSTRILYLRLAIRNRD